MSSVTGRISEIKQPRGGYIKPSQFEAIEMNDGIVLNEEENIHGSVVGMAVDYLSRFVMGAALQEAFSASLRGAVIAEIMGIKNAVLIAKALLNEIKGIDDNSVVNACKLVTFDVWFRNPTDAVLARTFKDTNPDDATIQNIQILIKRSLAFFEKYGRPMYDGFTFEPADGGKKPFVKSAETGKGNFGGYTAVVNSGDGDFLTEDTIWDFKVSKSKPTNKHTLQLLMYWIMGQHSGQEKYKNITKLGIFNPRLNIVYLLSVKDIEADIIKTIEKEVICYK